MVGDRGDAELVAYRKQCDAASIEDLTGLP
jgi:hypothetical protein